MVRAAGGSVALVEGDPMLEKVTYPADFAAADEIDTAPLTGLFDGHAR